MSANIGFYSYSMSLAAYGFLTVLVLITWRKRLLAAPTLIAALLTAAWAAAVIASTLASYPQIKLMQLAEIARNGAWSLLLIRLISYRLEGTGHALESARWVGPFMAYLALALGAMFGPDLLATSLPLSEELRQDLVFATWLAMATLGLILIEQLYRNSTQAERWSTKHVCLGLGALFAYDFFMYAEALLFRQLDASLWQARGSFTAVAALPLIVGITRTKPLENGRAVNISRHVAFHSVTLFAAGLYLLLMALVGYFIRYLGGTWGGVLQITFLAASGLILIALLFSGQIRAYIRVWLSKNFFSYKYDYRVEWLRFTQTLITGSDNIPENIIKAIAHLSQSPSGLLWNRTEDDQFELEASWEMVEPSDKGQLGALPQWLQQTGWVIDLKEWRKSPDLYDGFELPKPLAEIPRAWLIIPLMFNEKLQGILLLGESSLQAELNWEDRDLLKVAGRQAASHLAQFQANKALVELRQFEAFNRLSAYVVHDLKNILAQQSMIVSNAEKHRDKPEFIDDVFQTVGNSVTRMTRLMEQMRSGVRGTELRSVNLPELLAQAVASRSVALPVPTLETNEEALIVDADRDQLANVFVHIIQNAQEATENTGSVTIRLTREDSHEDSRAIIEIEDTGIGMDETFIRDRLFKPFDTTKGLTGMGIGAFESRELIRSLKGDITVTSAPNQGARFRITLPSRHEPQSH